MGFEKTRRIMTGVVLVFLLLNLVVLRDTADHALKSMMGYAFILIIAVLLVLLYLNRYRP